MTVTKDYERVERAIVFIAGHSPAQPSLADVARHVGLSEFHFQRLFTRWAGITPKRFAQYLTLEHAKVLLRNSANLLDATYASGLSSPGRLHDLFVTVEAMTPGEYRTSGAGLQIRYGIHESPFGDVLIATTGRGICGVYFVKQPGGTEPLIRELAAQWPAADLRADQGAGRQYAERMFALGESSSGEKLPLLLKGTNFQVNVWKALLRIPGGAAVTYEQLAQLAGTPDAIRAVGTAVGRNPISYLVPCHRVIRKTGEFGNYGGGIERKRAMLVWESATFPQGD
jgi:AraC family transcriptional regulator of adaptative response/methylated-DNA-[protein]-cysteine methyltransferase